MYKLLLFLSFPYFACAITGGSSVESSERFPFAVTLTNPVLCGGSIISLNPPWVLTAAHCIENYDVNSPGIVSFGSIEYSNLTDTYIKRAVKHPLYIPADIQLRTGVFNAEETSSVPYDIALVELKDPLEPSGHINRIRLLSDQEDNHRKSILETIGMGYTGLGKAHASVLQYAQCDIISNMTPLYGNNYNNSVILVTSTAGLCHGDSGSSLIYKPDATSPEYYLKGILNRINNAFDPEPENRSCPLNITNTSKFINIFVKPGKHINWISEVTGLSLEELTNTATHYQNEKVFSKSSEDSSAQSTRYINEIISIFFLPLSIFLIM